jgi:alkanesulfonate monooxygenase SsuD/methylene tetrahydromethanopterin reductase-like flavin-dependent oxidoreductase (luciferase family)
MGVQLFGLNIATAADSGADPVARAVEAEELGFDFVSASDHPCGTNPSFETWTMLSWIAASTSRIRVATRVLGVPYRPPTMVAKMAETFDRLSGGRLILGLGGGYSDEEFRAFGLRVPTAGEKVDGLAEAVQIARGLWAEPKFSFDGSQYRTEEADLEPKPDHRIPIWLGTYGPRALEVTGRLADGWIPSLPYAPPDRVAGMRDRVLAAARDAGRDPSEITRAYNVGVRVDARPGEQTDIVSGPADVVVDRLLSFANLGFTAINFMVSGPDFARQVEVLAREVIPAVRAAG